MSTPTYVLGTNLSHDGSACLLKDGRVVCAIEKERITRRKHDGFNDSDAIQYCLDRSGIQMHDLTLIVQNTWDGMFERGNAWYHGARILDPRIRTVTISHHLAHAYAAFATSPFSEADVLVIDNGGNSLDECLDLDGCTVPTNCPHELRALYSEVDSFYHFGADGTVRPLFKDFSPPAMVRKPYPMLPRPMMHSIGGVYASVSYYMFGYGTGMDDSGKLMGLAPYGRPGVYQAPMFDLRDDRAFVCYDWQASFNNPCRSLDQFYEEFQYYADIAYWTQQEVQRAIEYLVERRRRIGRSRQLCYAGGVALNAVTNGRLLERRAYDDIYFQPSAGDNGIALGCAFFGWLHELGRPRIVHDGSTYFGAPYDATAVDNAIADSGAAPWLVGEADIVEDTARFLAEGCTVGWFQGGAEFGPRALGNRSILADPRLPDIRQVINRRIKNREDFRPFAPSVLLEDVERYFECRRPSPYMIVVAPMKTEWRARLPGVVHCDGSSRLHTVTRESNPLFCDLLQAFKAKTGIGILLNTSFNKRGEPIVETPSQALQLFSTSEMDALVLGTRMLRKRETTVATDDSAWETSGRATHEQPNPHM